MTFTFGRRSVRDGRGEQRKGRVDYYAILKGHLSRFNIEVGKPPVREFINITFHLEMISPADFHLKNTHEYSTIIQEIQVY